MSFLLSKHQNRLRFTKIWILIPATPTHQVLGTVIYCVWFLVVLSQLSNSKELLNSLIREHRTQTGSPVFSTPHYLPVLRKNGYCIAKINITGKAKIMMLFIEYSLQLDTQPQSVIICIILTSHQDNWNKIFARTLCPQKGLSIQTHFCRKYNVSRRKRLNELIHCK